MRFDQPYYSVAEDAGTVTLNVVLGAQDPTQAEVWVTLETANGPLALCKLLHDLAQSFGCPALERDNFSHQLMLLFITVGTDFTAPALDELFFPVNSGDGTLLPVTIGITDDSIFEKDHAFTVAITSTEDNVDIEEPSNVTVTIEDDEGM